MSARPVTLIRGSAVVRIVWGAILMREAKPILARFGNQTETAVVVARVLAGRHLLQGAVTAAVPRRGVVSIGAVADLTHAATAVAAAVMARRWRTVTLTDAALAAVFAGVGLCLAAAVGANPSKAAAGKGMRVSRSRRAVA
jgi:hypothetical protein